MRTMVGRSAGMVAAVLCLTQGSCAYPAGRAAGSGETWLEARGFGLRREWGSTALHLRGPQLRSTQRLSILLRRVAGVRLRPSSRNPLGLIRERAGEAEPCDMSVHLNGVRLQPEGAEARVDLDARVGVSTLDALELHLGPDGPVFDPEGCGSLLLWDRGMERPGDPPFVGSIRGHVEGPSAGEVAARLAPDGPPLPIGADGSFVLPGLLPGAYEIELLVEGRPVARFHTRVYAGAEARVRLALPGSAG